MLMATSFSSGARSWAHCTRTALACALLLASLPAWAAASKRTDDRVPADEPPAGARQTRPIIRQFVRLFTNYSLFLDPDPYVSTKEFTLFYNTQPDPARGPAAVRGLYHMVYQRSSGPQQSETTFGHAWSVDLLRWAVDTLAFSIDSTAWNAAHVWSPSLVHFGGKDYLFYTGVDGAGDQRIGYASTDLMDTTDTEWDIERVKVLEAADTRWAVPDPSTYGGFTQFRDPYVMQDPEHADRLLMYYNAHDSTDFLLGRGGMVVGVARSEPGRADRWQDLGYLPSTLARLTKVGQLEGPHMIRLPGANAGWRLMFSNAGSPPGENGSTTIRFESLAPGMSVADTTLANWSLPTVLSQYLHSDATVYGWSGSEYLRVGDAEFLAGFTAWGPILQGIAIARMQWQGTEFTLGGPIVTGVDEYRSPTRDVRLALVPARPGAERVRFAIDSPVAFDARLELFDAMGRRQATLLDGRLAAGHSAVEWNLTAGSATRVPSGVYFARLSFAGGNRMAQVQVVR